MSAIDELSSWLDQIAVYLRAHGPTELGRLVGPTNKNAPHRPPGVTIGLKAALKSQPQRFALKMHGGLKVRELDRHDPEAVNRGLGNLQKHVENIRHFGESPIVALNHFAGDTDEEIAVVEACCAELGVPFREEAVELLFTDYYGARGFSPRGCHPRDLVKQIQAFAAYMGSEPKLDPESLHRAANLGAEGGANKL